MQELAEQVAEMIESRMTAAEREYLPVGQGLIDDILDWANRTALDIRTTDNPEWVLMQYEMNN